MSRKPAAPGELPVNPPSLDARGGRKRPPPRLTTARCSLGPSRVSTPTPSTARFPSLPLRTHAALTVGRLAATASRAARRGHGGVVGGTVALKLDPDALRLLARGRTTALVSGSNGKSTMAALQPLRSGGSGRRRTTRTARTWPPVSSWHSRPPARRRTPCSRPTSPTSGRSPGRATAGDRAPQPEPRLPRAGRALQAARAPLARDPGGRRLASHGGRQRGRPDHHVGRPGREGRRLGGGRRPVVGGRRDLPRLHRPPSARRRALVVRVLRPGAPEPDWRLVGDVAEGPGSRSR